MFENVGLIRLIRFDVTFSTRIADCFAVACCDKYSNILYGAVN